MENIFTVKQLTEILRLSDRRIRSLVKSGRLPAKKVGGQWLINKTDLDQLEIYKPGRPKKNEKKKVPKGYFDLAILRAKYGLRAKKFFMVLQDFNKLEIIVNYWLGAVEEKKDKVKYKRIIERIDIMKKNIMGGKIDFNSDFRTANCDIIDLHL